jgi:hypothetical protein
MILSHPSHKTVLTLAHGPAMSPLPKAAAASLGLFLLLPFLPQPGLGGSGDAHPAEPWVPPLGGWTVAAQQPLADSRERMARAIRATGPIEIDGRLDEPDWARAEPTSGFTQVEPLEGQPAMEGTEVRILYDDENLYIGARMYDSEPTRIARQLTPRGVTGRAAGYFEFSLDPNFDRSTGYTFRVTAANVQRDQYNYDDTSSDGSWDGIWESEVTIDGEGWIAEVRIPLSQLRFDAHPDAQVWGVNFARRRIADNERTEWAFVPQGIHGNVSRWGRLEGIHLTERRRYAEVVPYVLAGAEVAPAAAGDPFFDGSETQGRVGADIRYGLGSNFVVDMAVNPDFGQVQVDPRVINLSAFETFFPERRPFFTRDDALFDFGLAGRRSNLFYSRRIGRSPQGSAPAGADFSEVPRETAILGAAKLTGRTQGGLSLGALLAMTDRERGRAYLSESDETVRFPVEPRTNYATLRAQQDLREGQSRFGAIVTGVDRDLPTGGALDFIPRRAVTGGVDFEHSWADREWAISGFLAGSRVTGSEQAIVRLQRSSNHYFQRPDQDSHPLDPEATELTGAEWRLTFERQSGRHWTGAVWAGQRTPGFEVNDLGFSTDTERVTGGMRLQYRQPEPSERLQSYNVNFFTFHGWRNEVRDDLFSGAAWREAYKSGHVSGSASFTLRNWWGLGLDLGYSPRTYSDVMTRGGPIMMDPASWDVEVSMSTDRRDAVSYGLSVEYGEGARGEYDVEASFSVDARPSDALGLSVGSTYQRSLDPAQYVTQRSEAGFEPTFGGRYFFGELGRRQLSIDATLDYIFSPSLSLQIFAQPLIAAGEFGHFRQLAAPRTFDFLEFSEGDAVTLEGEPGCVGGEFCRADGRIFLDYTGDGGADTSFREQNFNVRSLRGTAALRWEYRPGSRVYLVWQQRRQDRETLGTFDLSRDARAMFEAPGEHVFMLKVDYWLSR